MYGYYLIVYISLKAIEAIFFNAYKDELSKTFGIIIIIIIIIIISSTIIAILHPFALKFSYLIMAETSQLMSYVEL